MKKEQQRIKIAEACGWKHEPTWHLGPDRFWGAHPEPPHTYQKLPDYLNDLNAMHEAEKLLIYADGHDSDIALDYAANLVICADVGMSMSATADQRAEALSKTLKLREETQ